MAYALTLHILAAIVWVGGMFLAYVCLRPLAASLFEPPQRLQLWCGLFKRFFVWVWGAVILLPLTGHWMIALLGGFKYAGTHVHIMLGTGYLMVLLFLHLYFAPFKRLKKAVETEDWPAGGKALNQIRQIVGINLALGVLTVINATGGRFFYG
ncbi:Phosphoribosylcarboxyaminoimidazole (NCAIR) mutase [Marinobacterium lacunae]|uniref:Phosphoribosylcarboxyaminoimidazole (NCAIR) mutase n=1 Tax=Marinobacterium lacunae TaxID=1232683 RepID=A0A081FXX0_9GAMM|nr:CopD family protein [Marinobacterium lacunae]KEA63375.1 Phosphoribosylcarboxyaminoimidazole (NCAIR) mutase [Marinobacterium lacunae]